jgi:hypothetical protein
MMNAVRALRAGAAFLKRPPCQENRMIPGELDTAPGALELNAGRW